MAAITAARRRRCSRSRKRRTLDVVYNLLVNKEERIPDIGYFRPAAPRTRRAESAMLFHAQEFHTSFWGHMGLLNLDDHDRCP